MRRQVLRWLIGLQLLKVPDAGRERGRALAQHFIHLVEVDTACQQELRAVQKMSQIGDVASNRWGRSVLTRPVGIKGSKQLVDLAAWRLQPQPAHRLAELHGRDVAVLVFVPECDKVAIVRPWCSLAHPPAWAAAWSSLLTTRGIGRSHEHDLA